MFIDTSAFVAILNAEPQQAVLADAIEQSTIVVTSPLVRLETCMVLSTRIDVDPARAQIAFDALVARSRVSIRPITDDIGILAVRAFEKYGKGCGQAAKLNLADCMSYACARAWGVPILFIGRDFSRTDIEIALPQN